MKKHPVRPRDMNQLARLVTMIATGEAKTPETDDGRNVAAVALGRLGGLKGGAARAKKLSAERRSAIAKAAAKKRWSKKGKQ